MIELVKHIEILLLENDCVIVPGLGGFIAHNRPALYDSETNEFYPPLRTIGFNPQLVMNDGLLVQSYMQTYNTDFPDATRKIEKIVTQLKEDIYNQGHVELGNIGTLYYNVRGVYEFEPRKGTFFTPSLYGLEKVTLPRLSQEKVDNTATLAQKGIMRHPADRPTLRRHKPWKKVASARWIQHAVSVAAAVLLFFILSTPVENTYVDEANYASLGSTSMFDAIRNQSIVTTLANYVQTDKGNTQQKNVSEKKQVRPKSNVNTLKPVVVRTEKVAAESNQKKVEKPQTQTTPSTDQTQKDRKETEKKASQSASSPKSYIIVASFPSAADAEVQAEVYRKDGYKNAQVISSNGRYRVAISQFSDAAEAYKQITKFKANNQFKGAWVYTSK